MNYQIKWLQGNEQLTKEKMAAARKNKGGNTRPPAPFRHALGAPKQKLVSLLTPNTHRNIYMEEPPRLYDPTKFVPICNFEIEDVDFQNIDGHNGSAEMAGYFTDVVDTRISDVRVLQRTDAGLVLTLRVPPFRPLGEVLLNIARHVPTARVLEISGQPEVQVRVSHDAESAAAAAAEAWLARLGPGVEVVARYAMPINGESAAQAARKQIALGVGVTHLMQLLRGCSGAAESLRHARGGEPPSPPSAVRFEQVYDFYC